MTSKEKKEIEKEAEKILKLSGEPALRAWSKTMQKFSSDMTKLRIMHQQVGSHIVREIEATHLLGVKKK